MKIIKSVPNHCLVFLFSMLLLITMHTCNVYAEDNEQCVLKPNDQLSTSTFSAELFCGDAALIITHICDTRIPKKPGEEPPVGFSREECYMEKLSFFNREKTKLNAVYVWVNPGYLPLRKLGGWEFDFFKCIKGANGQKYIAANASGYSGRKEWIEIFDQKGGHLTGLEKGDPVLNFIHLNSKEGHDASVKKLDSITLDKYHKYSRVMKNLKLKIEDMSMDRIDGTEVGVKTDMQSCSERKPTK